MCAAAQLGVADSLGSEERTVDEMGTLSNDPTSLYRLLRTPVFSIIRACVVRLAVRSCPSPRKFTGAHGSNRGGDWFGWPC